MSEQYFEAQPSSAHQKQTLRLQFAGRSFVFETDAGVFSRDGLDEGTQLLLDSVLDSLSGRILDLGCGWGPVGVMVSLLVPGSQVVMTDINARATDLAQGNLARNQASAQVLTGDGFEAVDGLFDWILLNPPIRAGKAKVYQLFAHSAAHLAPEGRLALVIRKQQGAASAENYLKTLFDQVDLIRRKKGYHIYICRRRKDEI